MSARNKHMNENFYTYDDEAVKYSAPSYLIPILFTWVVKFQAHFGCHDILMFGISPIKWRQCPDLRYTRDIYYTEI